MNDTALEFLKLDAVDRKVLIWKINHQPETIPGWVEYLAKDYNEKRSIRLNAAMLLKEIEQSRNETNYHLNTHIGPP